MEIETKSPNTVCRSVEYGLRAFGVWPGTSHAHLRRLLCISSMAVFQTFQYQHLITHYTEDISLLMDVLSATLAYSVLFIKMIVFALNARLLDEIVACLVEDWKQRDVSDQFTMTRMAYVSRWSSNFIISSNAMSVLMYAMGTLLKHKSDNLTSDNTRELLLKMELPFEIESTFTYIAVIIAQFVHQTSAASLAGVLNSFLLTLVLYTCGQIDIVRRKLSEITRWDIERGTSEDVVKTLIARHQKIIAFSRNIEILFSNIALIQFVSNTLVICCLGFLIVISIDSPNGSTMLLKSLLFYVIINIEAFLYCFVGEYLSTKSKMIGDAAYETLWYELKPCENRALLFMIVRSQRHLTLTVGKFVNLSLKQFGNIIKASASYVSVLHAMY